MAKTGSICNTYALELIEKVKIPYLKIFLYENKIIKGLAELTKTTKLLSPYGFNKKNCVQFYKISCDNQQNFIPTKNDILKLHSWLENQNLINLDKPFVYLHNRDSKFLPGDQWRYHSYRDFAPAVFIPIIKKYESELNFIRGGIVAEERLFYNPSNVVDLPFVAHDHKINILLQHESKFYFGSDSGNNCVANAFRKPIGGINFPSTAFGEMRKANFFRLGFIPKKLKDMKSNKYISLKEMYERNIKNFWYLEKFEAMQLINEENSQDEVSEFFDECLEKISKKEHSYIKKSSEQEEFWRIVTFYEPDSFGDQLVLDNCRIGEQFLRRNSYLIA